MMNKKGKIGYLNNPNNIRIAYYVLLKRLEQFLQY